MEGKDSLAWSALQTRTQDCTMQWLGFACIL
jgi:hypothetical protein